MSRAIPLLPLQVLGGLKGDLYLYMQRNFLGSWFRASYFSMYKYVQQDLAFISRTVHVSAIHHAHHQEYITVSAVVVTYERWIVKCSVVTL
jgi:hypothetical protein